MKDVEKFRGYVKEGKDPEFNKPITKYKGEDVTLTKPPYYVFRAVPKLHHCMGGVRINVKAQVISKNTQGPIPGLFAAGEAVGGSHGASRTDLGLATGFRTRYRCIVLHNVTYQSGCGKGTEYADVTKIPALLQMVQYRRHYPA